MVEPQLTFTDETYNLKGIFILSGNKELLAKKGDKTGIPYLQYHNFYRQRLLSNTPWAQEVFHFFNDSLFTDSSSGTVGTDPNQPVQPNDWDAEFKHAMVEGNSGSYAVNSQTSGVMVQGPTNEAVHAGQDSISVAMQDLSLQTQAPAAPVPETNPTAATPFSISVLNPTAAVPAVPVPVPVPVPATPVPVPIAVAPIPTPDPSSPAHISAPVSPAALSVAGSHAPGLVLQHQAAVLAGPASISAPVPTPVVPLSQILRPGDQETGAAAAELTQKKAKAKSKRTKVVSEAMAEDNVGGRKTRSKKGAAK